jgi:hypothetical protein
MIHYLERLIILREILHINSNNVVQEWIVGVDVRSNAPLSSKKTCRPFMKGDYGYKFQGFLKKKKQSSKLNFLRK